MPLEIKKGSELRQQYVISDCLGSGGYGIVWRATDKKAGRDVAIKRMLKQNQNENERLLSEAKKTAALKGHKNIVEVYEVFEEDGEVFLVMEYVDGTSLEEIIKKHIISKTWLDLDEALDYFRQTLQALVYAHSSGLYHRDIKPANLAQNDDWIGAINKYREAIAIDAKYARAHANLGFALNNLGKYDDAIAILSQAITLTHDKGLLHRIYDYRGFSKSNLKDYEGAIEDFSKAIDLAAYNPRVFQHRAESKALAGKYNEAYSDVLQALRLDADYRPALRLKQKLETQGLVKPL